MARELLRRVNARVAARNVIKRRATRQAMDRGGGGREGGGGGGGGGEREERGKNFINCVMEINSKIERSKGKHYSWLSNKLDGDGA